MAHTRHFSYYINIPQLVGLVIGGICVWRWIKMEEAKAIHYKRSFIDICKEDLTKMGILK